MRTNKPAAVRVQGANCRRNGEHQPGGAPLIHCGMQSLVAIKAQASNARFGGLALLLSGLWTVLLATAPGVRAAVPLDEALDTAGVLTWTTTNASTAWTGQTDVTHDGDDAAATPVLNHNRSAMFQTTVVTGPGILRYWWKVSSETNNDRLVFYINNVEQARISGEVDWESRSFDIPSGNQFLMWVYVKNGSISAGQDRAWVDQVESVAIPTAPVITEQPVSATRFVGTAVSFRVRAFGSPTLSYRWLFNDDQTVTNGNGVSGATSGDLFISNAQFSSAGTYRAIISNSVGVATSSDAVLTVTNICTNGISPPLIYHGSEAGGGYIHVAIPPGCTNWGVINTNPWISHVTGTTELESFVDYAVTANTTAFWRTGHMIIGEQIFTAVQNPNQGCRFAFSPESASFGVGAVTSVVAVAATGAEGCNWFPSTTNRWITILSGFTNSGNATVGYALAPNVGSFARSGGIRVASQFFPISQAGTGATNPPTCVISISPTNRSHGYGSATNTVGVAAHGGCAWSVATTNSWISILSSLNNSNNGTVAYSLAPNTNSHARSGSIVIGGLEFLLTQSAPSQLQIVGHTPTNTTLSIQGSAGQMYVVECSNDLIQWTPISTNSAPSTVANATADAPQRFYRALEIP